jgi:dsDNA-specific endonuclease/ATPase MutS2
VTRPDPPCEPPPHRIPVEESIDLHAFAPRDVVSVVEEYLEAASMKRYTEVRLIHGKGTGAQRAAVRALLARHPLVERYSDSPPEAGGWGATRVTLKPGPE